MAETVEARADAVLTWSGRALDLGAIETELSRLRNASAGGPGGDGGLVLRASLANMVVYAEREEHVAGAREIIETLAAYHPSRALIIVAAPSDADSHIEAELAAHCHVIPGYSHNVCCEEITLRASGRVARHLHSIIVPLLVPDLPVFVWWTEGLSGDPHAYEELFEVSDRFFLDSACDLDQLATLRRLAALSNERPLHPIGDLNWGRLRPWRDIFRRQRGIAEIRHHLDAVQSIEIEYAGADDSPERGKAYLMLAWLARELGWETAGVARKGDGHIVLRQRDHPIDVYLRPVNYDGLDQGALVAMKIACQSPTARALLTISRTADPQHVTIRTEHKHSASEDHFYMPRPEDAEVLRQELDTPCKDMDFAGILRALAPLLPAS